MEKGLVSFMCLLKQRILMWGVEKESMMCCASNGCSHVSCVPSSTLLVLSFLLPFSLHINFSREKEKIGESAKEP